MLLHSDAFGSWDFFAGTKGLRPGYQSRRDSEAKTVWLNSNQLLLPKARLQNETWQHWWSNHVSLQREAHARMMHKHVYICMWFTCACGSVWVWHEYDTRLTRRTTACLFSLDPLGLNMTQHDSPRSANIDIYQHARAWGLSWVGKSTTAQRPNGTTAQRHNTSRRHSLDFFGSTQSTHLDHLDRINKIKQMQMCIAVAAAGCSRGNTSIIFISHYLCLRRTNSSRKKRRQRKRKKKKEKNKKKYVVISTVVHC